MHRRAHQPLDVYKRQELGVHIADVSNYVKPGSELDNEAFNRATSVYYACLLYTSCRVFSYALIYM